MAHVVPDPESQAQPFAAIRAEAQISRWWERFEYNQDVKEQGPGRFAVVWAGLPG